MYTVPLFSPCGDCSGRCILSHDLLFCRPLYSVPLCSYCGGHWTVSCSPVVAATVQCTAPPPHSAIVAATRLVTGLPLSYDMFSLKAGSKYIPHPGGTIRGPFQPWELALGVRQGSFNHTVLVRMHIVHTLFGMCAHTQHTGFSISRVGGMLLGPRFCERFSHDEVS
jgi:hypothetical protein